MFLKHATDVQNIQKGELARRLYPNMTFDVALPEPWVEAFAEEMGLTYREIIDGFVWLYPPGSIFGHAAPLHLEALHWLNDETIMFFDMRYALIAAKALIEGQTQFRFVVDHVSDRVGGRPRYLFIIEEIDIYEPTARIFSALHYNFYERPMRFNPDNSTDDMDKIYDE